MGEWRGGRLRRCGCVEEDGEGGVGVRAGRKTEEKGEMKVGERREINHIVESHE